jgi:hypothetical protein
MWGSTVLEVRLNTLQHLSGRGLAGHITTEHFLTRKFLRNLTIDAFMSSFGNANYAEEFYPDRILHLNLWDSADSPSKNIPQSSFVVQGKAKTL